MYETFEYYGSLISFCKKDEIIIVIGGNFTQNLVVRKSLMMLCANMYINSHLQITTKSVYYLKNQG